MSLQRGSVCLVLSMLFVFLACSSTQGRRSVGEVIDDAVITNKIKAKFMKDKWVKSYQIDVDSWKGIVSLKGQVETQQQIDQAIQLAEAQPGVREVKSYLMIGIEEDSSTEWSHKSHDEDIQEIDLKELQETPAVTAAEKEEPIIAQEPIKVPEKQEPKPQPVKPSKITQPVEEEPVMLDENSQFEDIPVITDN